jgi:hypothetical protein
MSRCDIVIKFNLIDADHAKEIPLGVAQIGDKRTDSIIFSTQAT